MFSKDKPNSRLYNFLRGSIIIIEGPIGVGKTTLGESMAKVFADAGVPCVFYPETVHTPWLEMFLSDMAK